MSNNTGTAISLSKTPSSVNTTYDVYTRSTDALVTYGEDENKTRGNWSGRLDFLLSCIGYAVGLGNVWRFPYLCYRNGGGAFLIPYTIMLVVCGLPLFFFELSLGQYVSLGPISVWNISPAFKGIGYATTAIVCIVGTYYNVIIAYTIFYFAASFTSVLPWSHCNNPWNTPACGLKKIVHVDNDTMFGDLSVNGTITKRISPAQEYWDYYVLDRSPGIHDLGGVRWQMALCLLLAWIVIFLCLSKGIKSSGKVVYFTAVFPYIVLVILLIRGVTLPGSSDGIAFYIVPKWAKLKDPRVWGDAAVQIFYSLGPGWGGLITMASYNRFHNNCYRDSIIVSLFNCGTSVFAGFAIFSLIGFMAHELGVPISEVADSGPGLAFVAYPTGIAMLPASPFWSVLFFFMLFTLGLDSQFAGMEAFISSLADEFPRYLRTYKTFFTMLICIIGYIMGLPITTRGGIYLLTLMDFYGGGFALLIICFFELTVVMHIYGYKRFATDIQTMLGFRPNWYWIITWNAVTPLTIVFIIVSNSVNYAPVMYNDYVYPKWAETLGWMMMTWSVMWIPIWLIYSWIKSLGSLKGLKWAMSRPWTKEIPNELFHPMDSWGPALEKHRKLRKQLEPKIPGIEISKAWNNTKQIIPKSDPEGGYSNPAMTLHPSDPIQQYETYI